MRPRMTIEQAHEVMELMAEGTECIAACRQVDVGHVQFLDYCADHGLMPALRRARASLAAHLAGEVMDEARTHRSVDTGYLNAIKWRTATLDRETFGDRQTLSHEVAPPSALDNRVNAMSDDQVLSLIDTMIAHEGARMEDGETVRIEAT